MGKHRLLAERIAHERELRSSEKAAFDHERELRAVYDAHERELRLQQEAAVDKARQYQLTTLEVRLEGMNEFRAQLETQTRTFMTTDRFEREHAALVERHVRDLAAVNEKLQLEEKVTVRQDTTQAVLDKLAANNRWMIGILVASTLSLLALILHLAGLY